MEICQAVSVMRQPEQAASLANAPAGSGDRRAALMIALLSALVLAAVIPIVSEPWPPALAFVPAFQIAIAVIDLVTAALLFGQFRETHSPSLLLLAGGYLFTACLIVAHTLSFPGLFGAGILLGGPQTSAWIWFAWHMAPPLVLFAYAFLIGRPGDAGLTPRNARLGAIAAILLPLILAGTCILASVVGHASLPVLPDIHGYIPGIARPFLAVPLACSILALATLAARTRLRRALDLWLAVAAGAWCVEILLGAVLNTGRFEAGFYIGRLYALLASCAVLISLLLVAAATHSRLARALTLERERADDLERSEAALQQAQKMEAVGQLTSGVAHDFNNLLTGIIGALDTLVSDPLSEFSDRGSRMVKVAQQSSARGTALIGQLLAFSRQQRLETGPVDLNALAAGMQDMLRSTLGTTVQIEVAPTSSLPYALADRVQVEVVLLNLAINARDAMPQGGTILIETGVTVTGEPTRREEPPSGEWVYLSVSDTGGGMPPEVLERVFEPFFTTKAVGHGSGLGLPQVLGVAKRFGGGVRIESTHGEGCTVRLYLPKAQVEAKPAAASRPLYVAADASRAA
jgi:signal transduction histidine kinase